MIDLDKKDRLGIPMSRSWQPEFDLISMIESLGLTVDQAALKRKSGDLPANILAAWDEYDALNKARFSY